MSGISVAESSRAKRTPKVLRKMEIEPRLGGGHVITHHYDYPHNSEPHEFNKHEGDEAMAHIMKHAGIGEQEGSEAEPIVKDKEQL